MPCKAHSPKYQHFMLFPVLVYSKYEIWSGLLNYMSHKGVDKMRKCRSAEVVMYKMRKQLLHFNTPRSALIEVRAKQKVVHAAIRACWNTEQNRRNTCKVNFYIDVGSFLAIVYIWSVFRWLIFFGISDTVTKTCFVYKLCISSKAAEIICLRSQCYTLGMSYKSETAALIKASSGTLTNLTKLIESADRCFAISSH